MVTVGVAPQQAPQIEGPVEPSASRSPPPIVVMAIGALFLLVGLAAVFLSPTPTANQAWVVRVVVAIGGGLLTLGLTGSFQFEAKLPGALVKGGGSLGIVALLYLADPPGAAKIEKAIDEIDKLEQQVSDQKEVTLVTPTSTEVVTGKQAVQLLSDKMATGNLRKAKGEDLAALKTNLEGLRSGTANVGWKTTEAVSDSDARALLQRWLAAQNGSDFDDYQRLYTDGFKGVRRSGSMTGLFDREKWMVDRKRMFDKRAQKVEIADVRTTPLPAGVRINFVQTYQLGDYKDRGPKELLIVRAGDQVRIAKEELFHSEKLPPD